MATISTLRTQLQDVTGRPNLALDKTLCDRVINRACRYAESLQDTPQSTRRYFFKPAADAKTTSIADLRNVLSIWVSDGTDRGKLAYMDYQDAKEEGLIGVDNLVSGTPVAYSIHPAGLAGSYEDDSDSTDLVTAGIDSYAYADIVFSLAYNAVPLLWLPPSDGTWSFDLEGKWWPRTLSDSVTTNWWSVNQPDTIVYFAAMFLALERGNAELARHWRETASLGMTEVDNMMVENELAPYMTAPGNLFIRG